MPDDRKNPEAILKRLEWTIIRRLDGLLHGDYRTLFRGFGLDLADLREYQFNDDVRHIDWNVTARLQTPYVREYNEEREITVWFLLDVSPSVDFGSEDIKKLTVLTEFVAVLSRLLTRHGNRVGAMFYTSGIDAVIPPGGGRMQVLHIMNKLLNRQTDANVPVTDLKDFLTSSSHIMKRRSLVFVISDFISPGGWSDPLLQLSMRHEVLAVRLFDPLEMDLPDLGLFVMQDSETGEQLFVDTHDRKFRERFARAAERQEEEVRSSLQKANVDTLELSTDDDLIDAIFRFTDLRKHRTQLAATNYYHGLPSHMEIN